MNIDYQSGKIVDRPVSQDLCFIDSTGNIESLWGMALELYRARTAMGKDERVPLYSKSSSGEFKKVE